MKKELVICIATAAMAAAPAAFAQGAASPAQSPTAPDAVAMLQKVCLPVLRGGSLKGAAQSAGFKLEDGGWVLPITGKSEIDLSPPDALNPHVCTLSISAPSTQGEALRTALGAWARAQSPPLKAVAVDENVPGASGNWVTSTWSAQTPKGAESVVLTQPQPAAPQPAASSQPASARPPTTLLVSITPA